MVSEKDVILTVREKVKQAESAISFDVLTTLRHLRDNMPEEWVALIRADTQCVIPKLWDKLQSKSLRS